MTGPDNPERRSIITGAVEYRPYAYPNPIVPAYSDDMITATERWINRITESSSTLHYFAHQQDSESKRLYLTWLTQRTIEERAQVEELFQNLPNLPIDPYLCWFMATPKK